jgi:phosphoribosyl 1,2-cyclic phosphate phosphodiesterase
VESRGLHPPHPTRNAPRLPKADVTRCASSPEAQCSAHAMGNFTFTFLGTGTSQGIPVVACDCAVCHSSDPRDQRTRASAYVETPECAWVIDTGPDFRLQALREKIHRMDAVILTHAHTDHIMGFDDLRPFCHGGRELPVYASPDTLAQLKIAFAFAFDGKNRFPGYIRPDPHIVERPFTLGATELVPLPVPHGRTTTYGYLFVREGRRLLAYISDCKEVPESVRSLIRGVDTLVLDALRHREHPTHMNVAEAIATATAIQPRQTLLTHLSHDLAHAELEADLPKDIRIAYDGLRIVL